MSHARVSDEALLTLGEKPTHVLNQSNAEALLAGEIAKVSPSPMWDEAPLPKRRDRREAPQAERLEWPWGDMKLMGHGIIFESNGLKLAWVDLGHRPDLGRRQVSAASGSTSLQLNPGKDEIVGGTISRTYSEDLQEELPRVTRSIMIKRPAGCPSPASGTPPASPAGSTPPLSPFSGGKEWNRFRRKSSSDAYERACGGGRLAKSPSSPYEV
ncbi:dormancy-associated protein homolog 3-like [Phalaenopsis equestris]|uniref:dormancy-associated protein homolog 3-like n=1 Tax=Phalaenopsis equestris TaxID=78828 RepID=UPI0009E2EB8B|nr:dormancy-associated protein homolog 3-like [Phalaenopsis equestris]